MSGLIILGGGGHASDVLSVVESLSIMPPGELAVMIDEGDPDLGRFAGRPARVVSSFEAALAAVGGQANFVSGLGYPQARAAMVARAHSQGWRPKDPLIHSTAVLNANVQAHAGVVIMGHSWISPSVQLGPHVYVGYGVKLGHDCIIGEYSSVLPGCFVGGDVVVHDRCMIGANATVLQGVTIGARAQIGAGAVVTKDVPADVTVAGVPAVQIG